MKPLENVNLALYSTMRLGGNARYVMEITNKHNLVEAASWAAGKNLPILMIGGGSNIVWQDSGFDGLLLVNKIGGYAETPVSDRLVDVTIGAGEGWDSMVARTVASGLSGIEALSLIPGTTGATPIQNVGAYGQDISETLLDLEAYDLQTKQFVTIAAQDCQFAYRSSRFKTVDRGRFLITHITLRLACDNPQPPFYRAVEDYFGSHGITSFTPQSVREAVIDIRSHKLPDPARVANNGSFFANPIIDTSLAEKLSATFTEMPLWLTDEPDKRKIPAAWLIEQAGFKDYHDTETGMATWKTQPLVLVNEHAASTADLVKFKTKIVDAVFTKFQITLEQEPELLPTTAQVARP